PTRPVPRPRRPRAARRSPLFVTPSACDSSSNRPDHPGPASRMDQILTGDCLEHLAGLPAGCVDLAFADPPFNIGYEYDVYNDRQGRADSLAWTDRWLAAVKRVLKPDGSFYVAIGDEYAAELKVRLDGLGLTMRNWIVWHYTFGVNCTRK